MIQEKVPPLHRGGTRIPGEMQKERRCRLRRRASPDASSSPPTPEDRRTPLTLADSRKGGKLPRVEEDGGGPPGEMRSGWWCREYRGTHPGSFLSLSRKAILTKIASTVLIFYIPHRTLFGVTSSRYHHDIPLAVLAKTLAAASMVTAQSNAL